LVLVYKFISVFVVGVSRAFRYVSEPRQSVWIRMMIEVMFSF